MDRSTDIAVMKKQLLLKPTISETKYDCCICLETNVLENQKTECGHCICTECFDQMRKPVCPMCRADISLSETAQNLIDKEKNEKLKFLAYARLFRGICPDYIQMLEIEYEENSEDNYESQESQESQDEELM